MTSIFTRCFPVLRALALYALFVVGVAQAQPVLPVTGHLDFGTFGVFPASSNTSIFRAEELAISNPFDPLQGGRLFGRISADLAGGAIRGAQEVFVPWDRGAAVETRGRVAPVFAIAPLPGKAPGLIPVSVDFLVSGDFNVDDLLFGPSGKAIHTFDANVLMRNVSTNSGTLVQAGYRYERSVANSGTGVSDSASHTPSTFEVSALYNASVDRFGPLRSEYLQGFQNIGLHIDFLYNTAGGALISVAATVASTSAAQHGAASADWINSALLDLRLPEGYALVDSSGNRLDYNWNGNGGIPLPAIPEPESWLLFCTGLGTLLAWNQRRLRVPRSAATL
jgi:hypothetical protein